MRQKETPCRSRDPEAAFLRSGHRGRFQAARVVKSPADFKGRRIGVTAPGSSTAITAQYAMAKAGLKPNDTAFIGIGGGAGAVAAMQKGEIDIVSHLDPVIAKLEEEGLTGQVKLNIVERGAAVEVRLAQSEHVHVRAVQHGDQGRRGGLRHAARVA